MVLNKLTIPEMELLERLISSFATNIHHLRGTVVEKIFGGDYKWTSKQSIIEIIPTDINYAALLIDLSVAYTQMRMKKLDNLSNNFLVVIELIAFARDMREYTETLEPEFRKLSNRLWGCSDDFIIELDKIGKNENGQTTNGTA